jgi:DNA replication and repair protein RecF
VNSRARQTVVSLRWLELVDFRCFGRAELEPDLYGLTAVTGQNGSGKTSLLEAVAYLGSLRSFRGASREAMVRVGQDRAIVRAEALHGDRTVLIEAEVNRVRPSRVQLNRKAVRSRHTLAENFPSSVFSPDDLALVQGGPAHRRNLLDQAVVVLDPVRRSVVEEYERCVRQRNNLLRQAVTGRGQVRHGSKGGSGDRPDREATISSTLGVWDERMARAGESLFEARQTVLERLAPYTSSAYRAVATGGTGGENDTNDTSDTDHTPGNDTVWYKHERGSPRVPQSPGASPVELRYERSWEGSLREALRATRDEDLRRGATGLGPHHDDVVVLLDHREARSQASQGEQRSLAVALRLALHQLVAEERGVVPLLLLDDVLSELDPGRAAAVLQSVPTGPAILTTASPLPPQVEVASVVDVEQIGTVAPHRAADAWRTAVVENGAHDGEPERGTVDDGR